MNQQTSQHIAPKTAAFRGVFGGLNSAIAGMFPDLLPFKTARDLARCGFNHPKAYENYLALRNALLAGTICVWGIWLIVMTDSPEWMNTLWIVGAIASVLVYALPRVYLSFRGEQRVNQVLAGLPDALDTLVMGMSGGLSLQQSLQRTGRDLEIIYPSLSRELELVSRQTEVHSLPFALKRFAQRMDIEELSLLTETINHSLGMGTPIIQVLRSHADQVRSSRMQRAVRLGNTVSLKILFPTILCLAPAAFIVILSPPLLELRAFRDREKGDTGALSRKGLQQTNPSVRGTAPSRRP